jgi:hypothetical protein
MNTNAIVVPGGGRTLTLAIGAVILISLAR